MKNFYSEKREKITAKSGEEMRRFAHQILTKQLKVILGFESGKRWKE